MGYSLLNSPSNYITFLQSQYLNGEKMSKLIKNCKNLSKNVKIYQKVVKNEQKVIQNNFFEMKLKFK